MHTSLINQKLLPCTEFRKRHGISWAESIVTWRGSDNLARISTNAADFVKARFEKSRTRSRSGNRCKWSPGNFSHRLMTIVRVRFRRFSSPKRHSTAVNDPTGQLETSRPPHERAHRHPGWWEWINVHRVPTIPQTFTLLWNWKSSSKKANDSNPTRLVKLSKIHRMSGSNGSKLE